MIAYQYDPQKITTLRKSKGLSMPELAKRVGVSQPAIWGLERGTTKRPRAETLIKVAAALGVPLQSILKTTKSTNSDFSVEQMAAVYEALDPSNKQAVIAAAQALLTSQKRR